MIEAGFERQQDVSKRAENPKSIFCGIINIIKSFRAAFNAFKKISGIFFEGVSHPVFVSSCP